MTREDIKRINSQYLDDAESTFEMEEVFALAIKVIDQELVLDKIRAEIITRDRNVKAIRSDGCCFFTAEEVLEIIDKYKAESEE